MRRFVWSVALLGLLASPFAIAKESATPLIKAVESGKLDRVVKQLDKGGNEFEAFYQGKTALFVALLAGRRDLAELLASRGARVTQVVDNPDRNPKSNELSQVSYLGWAVQRGDTDLVKWLLEKGANPYGGQSWRRRSSLHMAADLGHVEAVRSILASQINPGVPDVFKDTPLHVAAGKGRAEVAQLLLLAGAPVDARNDSGLTPLMEVFQSTSKVSAEDQIATARVLIDAGADVNAYADYAGPPLKAFISIDSSGAFKLDSSPFAQEATDFLLSRGATYAAVNAWSARTGRIRAQDAVELARYETAQKEAALAREREREAARAGAASGNVSGAAGSCSCTQRSMRWVPGREQLRGHYEFVDVRVPCACP